MIKYYIKMIEMDWNELKDLIFFTTQLTYSKNNIKTIYLNIFNIFI